MIEVERPDRKARQLDGNTDTIETRISELVVTHCPAPIGLSGVGPTAQHNSSRRPATTRHGSDPEAAFAELCGACPMPASSVKTDRHRLNRGGDSRANNALFTIVLNRMQRDARTRAYVERRTWKACPRKRSSVA